MSSIGQGFTKFRYKSSLKARNIGTSPGILFIQKKNDNSNMICKFHQDDSKGCKRGNIITCPRSLFKCFRATGKTRKGVATTPLVRRRLKSEVLIKNKHLISKYFHTCSTERKKIKSTSNNQIKPCVSFMVSHTDRYIR